MLHLGVSFARTALGGVSVKKNDFGATYESGVQNPSGRLTFGRALFRIVANAKLGGWTYRIF